MAREMSEDDFVWMLAREVGLLGGPAAAGRLWGEHPQTITNVIACDRHPSPNILKGMGYREIKSIVRKYVPDYTPKKDPLTEERKRR